MSRSIQIRGVADANLRAASQWGGADAEAIVEAMRFCRDRP